MLWSRVNLIDETRHLPLRYTFTVAPFQAFHDFPVANAQRWNF